MRHPNTARRFRASTVLTPATTFLCASMGWSVHAADLMVPSQYATIQGAIDAAANGDQVLVAPGTYAENLDLGTKAITLRSTAGPATTILVPELSVPIVTVGATVGEATLEGFTIKNGSTASGGSGILAAGSALRIISCSLDSNDTTNGAGAAILATDASITIVSSLVINNEGVLPAVGVLDGGAVSLVNSALSATDTDFELNSSFNFGGGAIGASGASAITLADCRFLANFATTSGGSAIFVRDTTTLTIDRTEFQGNEVTGSSGTIRTASLAGAIVIRESDFLGNVANGAAAINLALGVGGSLTVTDTNFEGNIAGIGSGGTGGAIFITSSSSSVTNVFERCTFIDNSASAAGAMLIRGKIRMSDCRFEGNRATAAGFVSGGAGAIRNQQIADGSVFERCVFIDNAVIDGGEGGAVSNWRCRPLFVDCLFDSNFVNNQYGGAVFNESGSTVNPTNPTFTGCTFTNNHVYQVSGTSPFVNGGAVANLDGSGPTYIGCHFDGNTAWGDGGHVYTASFGIVTFDGCTFENGFASDGGALYSYSSGTLNVRNSLFAHNAVTGDGGGLSIQDARPLNLTNCTIVDNVRGGLHFWGNTNTPITGNIFWGNTIKPQIDVGFASAVTYSIVQGGYTGAGNSGANPLFVDAANGDYRLQPGSPAIDSADNTKLPSDAALDLDGNPRFNNDGATPDTGVSGGAGGSAIADRGAYEFQGGGPCLADYNSAGEAGDILDFLDFFDDFSVCEGGPGPCGSFGDADVNGDTLVDILDFLDFIDAFGTGC